MYMFTNMNQAQKDITIRMLTILGVFLALVCIMIFTHIHVNHEYDMSQGAKRISEESQVNLTKKERKIQQNITDTSSSSSDPILRDIGENHNDMKGMEIPIYKFAKVYYNWGGTNAYEHRPQKLTNVVTPNVLHDKALFHKFSISDFDAHVIDTHVTMNSVLSNMSVSQVSKNGSGTTALVDVDYTTWATFNSTQYDSSTDSSNNYKHNSSQWLLVSLNNKKNQITNIKPLYLNPNAHLSSMDTSSSQAGSGVNY